MRLLNQVGNEIGAALLAKSFAKKHVLKWNSCSQNYVQWGLERLLRDTPGWNTSVEFEQHFSEYRENHGLE